MIINICMELPFLSWLEIYRLTNCHHYLEQRLNTDYLIKTQHKLYVMSRIFTTTRYVQIQSYVLKLNNIAIFFVLRFGR